MATASEPVPVKAPKHESFVEEQLHKATSRIRLLDIGAALLILGIGTFVYGLAVVLLDRWLELPDLARQIAFGVYALAGGLFVARRIVWPLCQRINPYYAAVQVEHAVPGAKNSVVNWLDLKDDKLPGAIRAAVGQKAARDLAQTPLEDAISGRLVLWLVGSLVIVFFALLVAMLAIGPGPFGGLIQRAFFPFAGGGIPSETTIVIVAPQPADASVPINQSVQFRVRVDGRVPNPRGADAVRLQFRYSQSDPTWVERKFERGGDEWSYRLPAFELHSGFWYKVAGGDFETAEHRLDVRSSPLVTGFEVKYQHRPYLKRPDYSAQDPNLEGLRGTAVTLTVRTNRPVKHGWLALDDKKTLIASLPVPESREAMRFHLVLDREGSYVIRYLTDDGEHSGDSLPYTIKVIQDRAPDVLLTEPGDVTLPLNGVLQPIGFVADDFGITGMTLRLRVKDGPGLAPRRYRDGKSFQFPDGTFPRTLDYSDVIELAKLTDEAGKPVALKPNMQIEYWLEAADNCDYPEPGPNVGQSAPPFVVTLAAAIDPNKQQQQVNDARQNQQQREQQQDQQLKRQPPEPEDINQPQEQPNPVPDRLDQQRNQRDAGDATAEDVEQAANDLKNNNPQRRQQGEQRLRDIEQQAKDEGVRNQAGEALEDAGLKERRPENATREDVNNASQDLQDPRKQQQARQRLNDIKDKAKQPDVRDAAQEALNNQPNSPDNATKQDVDRAAKNLNDTNPAKRQQARQDLRNIKDQAKDAGVQKAADQQLQQGVQNANQDDVKQANQDLQNGNQNQQDNAERDLRDMKQQAKDQGTQQAAADALKQAGKNPNLDPRNANQDDVKQANQKAQSNDPAQRQQGRRDLRDIANQAKDAGVRNAADQAHDQANQNANASDVKQGAQQAQSADAEQRRQGRQDLRDQANQAKDPAVQQAAEKALNQANQDANSEDVNQANQQAQSNNAGERQDGRQDLRDQANQAKDPATKDAAQQALNQANRDANPDDVKQAADQSQTGSAKERQQARQDLKQMQQAKDQGTQQAAKQAGQQANQNANQEDVKQAGQQAQQGGTPQQRQEGRQDLQQMQQQAKDPGVKKAAQQAGQQASQNATKDDVNQAAQQARSGSPQDRQAGRQDLRQMQQNAKDPAAQQGAEKALQQANQNASKPDVGQEAKSAQSSNAEEKQQGKDSLRDIANQAKDAGTRQAAQQALKQAAEQSTQADASQAAQQAQANDPKQQQQGKQNLRDMAKHAKDAQAKQAAQKGLQKSAESATPNDVDQAAKDSSSSDPTQKQHGQQSLKEMREHAKDPAARQQAADALKEFAKNATAEDVARAAKEQQEQIKSGSKPDPQDLKDMAELAKDPAVQKLAKNLNQQLAKQDQARDAGQPEVDQTAKDLKSGDPKKEQAAAEKLQDIAQQAKDEQARQQAEKALKDAGKPAQRPGQNATPKDVQQAKDKLKSTDPKKFEEGLKELGDAAQNADDPEAKAEAGQGLGDIGLVEGDRQKQQDLAAAAQAAPDTAQGLKAKLEHKRFAGDLQLRQFKETVTPDMLKKADVTPEEWARFMKDYADQLKRLDADLKDLEKFDPKERVVQMPGGGVRRIDAVQGTPENLQNSGQVLPPPQYRNAYQDFTRDLSKIKQKSEKTNP